MCHEFLHLSESDRKLIIPHSVHLQGCACAAVAVLSTGAIVYDYTLLCAHFREHEGLGEQDEEWIDYNIVPLIDYIEYTCSPDVAPIIQY